MSIRLFSPYLHSRFYSSAHGEPSLEWNFKDGQGCQVQAEGVEHVDDRRNYDAVVPVVEVFCEPSDPRFKWKETEWRPHQPSYWLDNVNDDPVVN